MKEKVMKEKTVVTVAKEKKTAEDATPLDLVAASLLRAYLDGKRCAVTSRVGRADVGLYNLPDDVGLVRLLWDEDDDEMVELRRRARDLAEGLLEALARS